MYNGLQQTYVWTGRGGYTSAYTTGSPSSSSLTVTLPSGATVFDAFLFVFVENANVSEGT